MFNNRKALSWLAPAVVGLGVTGAALASVGAGATGGPVRCEIKSSTTGGMVSLEGLVESDAAITGTYRFMVESAAGSGNSVIRQGGGFTAAPGEAVTLGRVMLGANGIYDASLELHANGTRVECEDRIGGKI